jgi:hypothetical protein
MSLVNLQQAILDGGINNANFSNGTLLTAESLTTERQANLARLSLLGTCLGAGVCEGLEVTLSNQSVAYAQQIVHVAAGIGINKKGELVQLPGDTDVALVPAAPTTTPPSAGLFVVCTPPQTVLTNPGIYILTILPASGYQGQIPVVQLNSGGVATQCSSRYATQGVQFRLLPVILGTNSTGLRGTLVQLANQIQAQLDQNVDPATIAPALSQFRNGLAHVCFGTEELAQYPANPLAYLSQSSSALTEYGLLDELSDAGQLTDCEIPLAIMYWARSGIQFIDLWSVRRPVFAPPASTVWAPAASPRRLAEGMAIFLQFQAQIAELLEDLRSSVLSSVRALDYFRYLPAAGFIPLLGMQSTQGFNYQSFFAQRTYRDPVFVEGAVLDPLIRRSYQYPPIDFSNQEMIWLYLVRENVETVDQSTTTAPSPYLFFCNGHIPFQGNAKYDLNYWNYANYASW